LSLASERYQVIEIIASGAHGVVCRALRTGSRSTVAVKILRSELANQSDISRRLRDEARMLTRIHHPNVVRVYEILESRGRPVQIMEDLRGFPLERLGRHFMEGLPPAIALEFTRQAAAGLDGAWTAKGPFGRPMRIIHRDISPANMILCRDGTLKVIDFGLATGDIPDRESMSFVLVRGTLAYSAPERVEGVPDSHAVDVYSLGVTLFGWLTGRTLIFPHDRNRHEAALDRQLAHVNAVGLGSRSVGLLQNLLRRMLAWNPRSRPNAASVQETVGMLLETAGLRPDAEAFARTWFEILEQDRPAAPLAKHPQRHEIEELLIDGAIEVTDVATQANVPGEDADRVLKSLLRTKGWERDLDALHDVLQRSPGWSHKPFLRILRNANNTVLRWLFPSPPDQVVAALEVLRHRPTNQVKTLARRLTEHPDERVSSAAKTWLTRIDA